MLQRYLRLTGLTLFFGLLLAPAAHPDIGADRRAGSIRRARARRAGAGRRAIPWIRLAPRLLRLDQLRLSLGARRMGSSIRTPGLGLRALGARATRLGSGRSTVGSRAA
jgi:hypothetical protein